MIRFLEALFLVLAGLRVIVDEVLAISFGVQAVRRLALLLRRPLRAGRLLRGVQLLRLLPLLSGKNFMGSFEDCAVLCARVIRAAHDVLVVDRLSLVGALTHELSDVHFEFVLVQAEIERHPLAQVNIRQDLQDVLNGDLRLLLE